MIDRICLTCDCYDPDYQIETDDTQDYFNNRGVSVDETVI